MYVNSVHISTNQYILYYRAPENGTQW